MLAVVWANFGIFFGTIEMFSCRDWWPWTKSSYITMNCWQSNSQWGGVIAVFPTPKKSECKNPLKNSLFDLSFFFLGVGVYENGILLIDYTSKDQTINAEYYSSLMGQLKDILKETSTGSSLRVSFLHDNATGHRALATHWLIHPPYCPDLAPSDYHLFPGQRKQLKVHHFSSDPEVIVAAETWLDGQSSDFILFYFIFFFE